MTTITPGAECWINVTWCVPVPDKTGYPWRPHYQAEAYDSEESAAENAESGVSSTYVSTYCHTLHYRRDGTVTVLNLSGRAEEIRRAQEAADAELERSYRAHMNHANLGIR